MVEWLKDRNSFNKEGLIYGLGWKISKWEEKKPTKPLEVLK